MKDFVQNVQEYTARGQDWSFTTLTDSGGGVTGTLVEGVSGERIKIVGFIISTTGAGVLEISISGAVVMHLEFNNRLSTPIYMPFPILVSEGASVDAVFTADVAPATCYVTTIYHMETI